MRIRLLPPSSPLWISFVLFAVFIASCAPVAATELPAPVVVDPTATLPSPEPTVVVQPIESTLAATEIPTEAIAPTAIPVATSRGPDLHATDPTTVNLASGQIQFVEFFRFT